MDPEITWGMFETQFIAAAILFVTAFLMGVLTKNPRTHRRWFFVGLGILAFYATTNTLYWWGRMPLRLFPFVLVVPIAANIGLWTGWGLRALVVPSRPISLLRQFLHLVLILPSFGLLVGVLTNNLLLIITVAVAIGIVSGCLIFRRYRCDRTEAGRYF